MKTHEQLIKYNKELSDDCTRLSEQVHRLLIRILDLQEIVKSFKAKEQRFEQERLNLLNGFVTSSNDNQVQERKKREKTRQILLSDSER